MVKYREKKIIFFSFEKSKTFLKIINKNFEIKNGNVASGDSFIRNKNYVNYVMFKKEKIDVIDMKSDRSHVVL